MKAVIQRVDEANVRIDDAETARIEKGVLVLLGIEKGDHESDADYIVDKIVNLRIFENDEGKMDLSLIDISGEMLVISQFTLLADCRKGRRPSFDDAAEPEKARYLYEYCLKKIQSRAIKLHQGRFQAMMKIGLVNDGPVTIILDSRKYKENQNV